MRHTKSKRPPAQTAQPTSIAISGTPPMIVSTAAKRPPPRQISKRRQDNMVDRGCLTPKVLQLATASEGSAYRRRWARAVGPSEFHAPGWNTRRSHPSSLSLNIR